MTRDNLRSGTATEVIEGRREQVVKFGLSSKIDDEAFRIILSDMIHTKAEGERILTWGEDKRSLVCRSLDDQLRLPLGIPNQ
jgi:hypothetical protein